MCWAQAYEVVASYMGLVSEQSKVVGSVILIYTGLVNTRFVYEMINVLATCLRCSMVPVWDGQSIADQTVDK